MDEKTKGVVRLPIKPDLQILEAILQDYPNDRAIWFKAKREGLDIPPKAEAEQACATYLKLVKYLKGSTPIIEVGLYLDIPLLPTKDMMWAIVVRDIRAYRALPIDAQTSMLLSYKHKIAYCEYMALVKHVLDN